MRLDLVRAEEVKGGMASGREQLGDEPPVAALPERLGAHEARGGLRERAGQSLLPGLRGHARRVAAEGRDGEAGEALLVRLGASPAPELHDVPIRNSRFWKGLCERLAVELGIAARTRVAPDVDKRPDLCPSERLDELVRRPAPMSDGEDLHPVINPPGPRGSYGDAMRHAWFSVLLLAGLGAAGLTACGSGGDETSGGGGGPAAQTIEIAETEFMLDPATVTVREPGTYTFHVVNDGGVVHAFEIEGPGIEEETADIDPGGSADLTIEIAEPGEYELYCPVDGHRERGMESTLSLGGGGGGGTTEDTTTEDSDNSGGYGY